MEISKIWLMASEDRIAVLVEVDGKWYELVKYLNDGEISHCAHVEEELPSNAVEADWLKPLQSQQDH